ncbi:hypothetical protein GF327_06240 [Candidatus Woesearchaeota archaeon]|nr:hypothetical protein [Candidatus Woesearchaeota archaeon]
MKSKHIFVAALDVGEILPFSIKDIEKLAEQIKEQERAKKELEKFIGILENKFDEPVWYMGTDIIGEKYYERFIFDNGGFFEIMQEPPVALNAHFVHEKRAEKFHESLKDSLKQLLPDSPISDMFLNSIEIKTQEADSLTVHKWTKMKNIRKK